MKCCSRFDAAEFYASSEDTLTSLGKLLLEAFLFKFDSSLFTAQQGHVTLKQILTHNGSSLLRVVAHRLRVWGESSGSVHSSGTAVRWGPLPLSQMYKAT